MFASLLGGDRPPASQSTPELLRYATNITPSRLPEPRHATADFTEADDDDDDDDDESVVQDRPRHSYYHSGDFMTYAQQEPVENGRRLPILPLFSASHLDSLPIYSLTHAIRILVQTRTETTLTWDQLRSPQVSQFLVKPMQQAIRAHHFSRATLYALMANTLQFAKEAQFDAGNAGVSRTRSKVCELLAIKLLKEYNTRELIDALSYDFHPLQGFTGFHTTNSAKKSDSRTSTLEVAIRASAKHFLSHPLVIQQLEAIWSGAISFYSAADNLHREKPHPPVLSSVNGPYRLNSRTPLLRNSSHLGGPRVHYGAHINPPPSHSHSSSNASNTYKPGRRTVSLYNPRYASPFKLSRLRVPRYRSFLSTISLAVLIGLLLAVLVRRSTQITGLELIFWFWSAGFMLDELVGFNEQGFSLYIMSFWNIFDLGILCMLILYYCMRAYGVFLLDPHHWNDMAYDVLAANAILLLPRIFSVLDHYPYFSQLLIAFRLMAVDLAAVMFLIIITCSGFFVYFTFSRNRQDSAEFAFSMFQIIMGFTPAAWDIWSECNVLGKSLLVLFLIICHFVIVTILITVLTNSFMAIASNATEEHQFLFAINTISMVKNDSLFSYIPPFNIFAWLLMPLRYLMPLRHFVWLNRLVIKMTHLPILWTIFVYERYFLASSIYEPTDLVDHPGVPRGRAISIADPASRIAAFSPNVRVREESVVGFQKDRALEEVFRRPPDQTTLRNQRRTERRRNQTEIRNWMDRNEETPVWQKSAQDSGAPDNVWLRRYSTGPRPPQRVSDMRSIASDPADLVSNTGFVRRHSDSSHGLTRHSRRDGNQTDGGDGDDELVTNDEFEDDNATTSVTQSFQLKVSHLPLADYTTEEDNTYPTPTVSRPNAGWPGSYATSPRSSQPRRNPHSRGLSSSTIMFNPNSHQNSYQDGPGSITEDASDYRAQVRDTSGLKTPTASKWSPRKIASFMSPPARPIALSKSPGIAGPARMSAQPSEVGTNSSGGPCRLSSIGAAVSESNILADDDSLDDDVLNAMSSSFQTQMAFALKKARLNGAGHRGSEPTDSDRMSKLVLARMKTLEESFAEVIREMRDLKDITTSVTAPVTRNNSVIGLVNHGKTGLASSWGSRRGTREHLNTSSVMRSLQKRAPVRRPMSSREYKSPRLSTSTVWKGKDKGKGKILQVSSGEDIPEVIEEDGEGGKEEKKKMHKLDAWSDDRWWSEG